MTDQAERKLMRNLSGHTYTLTEGDGTEYVFADFDSSWPLIRRGTLLQQTSSSGVLTELTPWLATDSPPDSSWVNLPRYVQTTYLAVAGQSQVVERMEYTYDSDRIASATLKRGATENSLSALRTVTYSYSDGDLQYVTIRDGDENADIRETQYYRWYTNNTSGGYDNGLKMWLGGDAYQRALSYFGTASAVAAASNTNLRPFADNYFEYESSGDHRVTKEIAQGAGCSCTGNGGQGEYTFSYGTESTNTGRNAWRYNTTETLPDGTSSTPDDNNQNIVYTNEYGSVVLKVEVDRNGTTSTSDDQQYFTHYEYDALGQVTKVAHPSALTTSATGNTLILNDTNASRSVYLRADAGLVDINEYYDDTQSTADQLPEGDLRSAGGSTSSKQKIEEYTYTDGGVSGDGIHYLDTVKRYESVNVTRDTHYTYDWYQSGGNDTTRMLSRAVQLPVVTTGQNGPGGTTGATSTEYYDIRGNVVWTVDAAGFINYYKRDPATGAVKTEVIDVEPSSITNPAVDPPVRDTNLPDEKSITTNLEVDKFGRVTKRQDSNGHVSYTVYDDTIADGDPIEARAYTGWDSSTHQPSGPVIVWRHNPGLQYSENLTYTYSAGGGLPVDDWGVPTGAESLISSDTHLQSLTRKYTNASGQILNTDRYFNLSGLTYSTGTLGSSGSNFYRTSFWYDHHGNLERVEKPTGTITRTLHDGLGRPTQVWTGTDDTPNSGYWSTSNLSGTNLGKITDYTYDADGNLTDIVQHVSYVTTPTGTASDDRHTKIYLDWRGRVVATKEGVLVTTSNETNSGVHRPIIYVTYNNLDEVTAEEQFDGDGVSISSSNGVPQAPSSGRVAKATTEYDSNGRVFAAHQFSVSSSGTVSSTSLTTSYWYDGRGNLIKTGQPGGMTHKYGYDGAGRQTVAYVTDGRYDTAYANVDDVIGDVVLMQTETTYDDAGNVIFVVTRERLPDNTE
ncbi:MAG: hypothetical protein H0U59_04455, partial [Gemmatimonadaceae bacterium]|nr:hypothetical protein [Gemmatimonadaceae bacterium]